MLFLYAVVSSSAVENPFEKKNTLENTYHWRFPEYHSWYVVLPSEWPVLLIVSERVVTGAWRRPQVSALAASVSERLQADTSLSSIHDPSSQGTQSVGGSVGAGLAAQVCSILFLWFIQECGWNLQILVRTSRPWWCTTKNWFTLSASCIEGGAFSLYDMELCEALCGMLWWLLT